MVNQGRVEVRFRRSLEVRVRVEVRVQNSLDSIIRGSERRPARG